MHAVDKSHHVFQSENHASVWRCVDIDGVMSV